MRFLWQDYIYRERGMCILFLCCTVPIRNRFHGKFDSLSPKKASCHKAALSSLTDPSQWWISDRIQVGETFFDPCGMSDGACVPIHPQELGFPGVHRSVHRTCGANHTTTTTIKKKQRKTAEDVSFIDDSTEVIASRDCRDYSPTHETIPLRDY